MKFGTRCKLGKNASANEKNSNHAFSARVTIAVLYWVYHDPNRRAQMAEAIRNAQYRWVVIGILAYVVVEVAAAFRWHVLLKVQKIHLSSSASLGLVFNRHVLQPVPAGRHRRRHH